MENKKADTKEKIKKGAIIVLPVVFALIAATLAAIMIGGAKVASGGEETDPVYESASPSDTDVIAPVESDPSGTQASGLEFRSNSDGSCTLVGLGSCKDKTVIIPTASPDGDMVTAISEGAFSGGNIKEIVISSSVMSIGEGAFLGCPSLEAITVNGANPIFASVGGVLFNREMTELICYPSGKADSTYVIPKSVTRIAPSAFSSCRNLTLVKYAGTKEQWKDVYVCAGNEGIVESKMTFAPDEK